MPRNRREADEQLKAALQLSLSEVVSNEELAIQMVGPALAHFQRIGIRVSMSRRAAGRTGDCLFDSIVLEQNPDISPEERRALTSAMRRLSVGEAIRQIDTMSEARILQLLDAVIRDEGRPQNREDMKKLLTRYLKDTVYDEEGGDLLPIILAAHLNRPIIIVDLSYLTRDNQIPIIIPILPDGIFETVGQRSSSPLLLVRRGEHFEPLLIDNGEEAEVIRRFLSSEEAEPAPIDPPATEGDQGAGEHNPGAGVREGDPGTGEHNPGAGVREGDPGTGEDDSEQGAGEDEPVVGAGAQEGDSGPQEGDTGAQENDPAVVAEFECEDLFEMNQDQQAASVEPRKTCSTITTTASGSQLDNQTSAAAKAPTSTTEHGFNMGALSERLMDCVLEDTPSSNEQINAGHPVEEEKKKEDLDSPVEDQPDAEHPEKKEGKKKDLDPPDSPHEDPPMAPCYVNGYKNAQCHSLAWCICVVCKRRSCWFHLRKIEVPGKKVTACIHCFNPHYPKSPFKGFTSQWMGTVKGRDFRLNS